MTWAATQRHERERAWRRVERYVAELPPKLSERFKLHEFDLAIRHSPSGQFGDLFTGVSEFPLLSVGSWVIRDLGSPADRQTTAVEGRLLVASVLLAVTEHVVELGPDGSLAGAAPDLALVHVLSERAAFELDMVPRSGPTRQDRARVLRDGLEASLTRRASWVSLAPPADPERYLLGRWSAPARAVARAALAFAYRSDLTVQVEAMLDAAAAAFEILGDLSSIHADLLAGRITYPIATVAAAAGLPLRPPPEPTAALGSLVLTGSIGATKAAAAERLRNGQAIAVDLGLDRFASFLSDVEAGLAVNGGIGSAPTPATPIVVEREETGQALEMAQGYLLADPALMESWETHREGMFGAPLVVSRFPAGLVLEILRRRGHQVGPGIEAFIDRTVANGFRYYDHPRSGVDTDTLGVVLRLLPDPARPGRWGAAIDTMLDALARAAADRGAIPVWIPDPAAPGATGPPILDLGDRCGTVACHLLLGLASYAPVRHASTISTGLDALLARINDVGLAANVNYTPAYALVAFVRLLRSLDRPASRAWLPGRLERAAREALGVLATELDRLLAWTVMTPQQAALSTTACLEIGMVDRIDPGWRTILLAGQRWDGSWPGEPFAVVPDRGRTAAWFTSAPLTTALCYDALARLGQLEGG
jgi:hypothetical protein